MNHLKTFEAYGKVDTDIHEDIAKDILPKLQKLKSEKGKFTIQDYMKYMEERGADPKMVDCVLSYIVNMGFDLDFDNDKDEDEDNFELKNVIY